VVAHAPHLPSQRFAAALLTDRRLVHAVVLVVAAMLVPIQALAPRWGTTGVSAVSHPRAGTPDRAERGAEIMTRAVPPDAPTGPQPGIETDPRPGVDLDRASPSQLQRELEANRAEQLRTRAELLANSSRIEALNDQVLQLDRQVAETEKRIQLEQQQARALARAIYAQPSSAALALAQSDNLGEFMTQTADLSVANSRARGLAHALEIDQRRLQSERGRVSEARIQQVAVRHDLELRLSRYQQMEAREQEMIAYWAQQAQLQAQQLQARVTSGPAWIQGLIREAFQPLGADVAIWALRVAACESGYRPTAVNSSSGAMGLFQFMPSTWARSPYAAQDPFDPKVNAQAAAWLYQRSGPGQWVCE
jgi:soluble lytic murein transglycosylase-like protein